MVRENFFMVQTFYTIVLQSKKNTYKNNYNWESVAGFVIKTTGTMKLVDGLRTRVLPGGYWVLRAASPSLGLITDPPWCVGWS